MDLGSLMDAQTSTGNCLKGAVPASPAPGMVFPRNFERILPPQVTQPQPHPAPSWEAAGREFHGFFTHGRGEGLAVGLKDWGPDGFFWGVQFFLGV